MADQLEPWGLIRHAERLRGGGPGSGAGRPARADVRRAVSAAYYAVFHAITVAVASQILRSPDDRSLAAARWVDHGDVARAGKLVAGIGPIPPGTPKHASLSAEKRAVWDLLHAAGGVSVDLDRIVTGTSALLAARHRADYDRLAVVRRDDAQSAIRDARATLFALDRLRSPDREVYLALIAYGAGRLRA